ncbi:hypothetical protein TYRP_011596 [Tyrophagus putrescentiae]|nr:hypothetical protein TYRP_011596 [Tyrophagus putrescentiae]
MNLINCLAQVVANHFRFLVYYLNPVVTERSSYLSNGCNSTPPSKRALEFLLPITAMVASFLYGTLYMVYADEGGHFSWEAMKVSPVMMYHQVLPRLTWPQLDGVVISANCTVVAIFGAFLAKRAGFTAGRYWVVNFERRRGEENRKDHRDKRSCQLPFPGL